MFDSAERRRSSPEREKREILRERLTELLLAERLQAFEVRLCSTKGSFPEGALDDFISAAAAREELEAVMKELNQSGPLEKGAVARLDKAISRANDILNDRGYIEPGIFGEIDPDAPVPSESVLTAEEEPAETIVPEEEIANDNTAEAPAEVSEEAAATFASNAFGTLEQEEPVVDLAKEAAETFASGAFGATIENVKNAEKKRLHARDDYLYLYGIFRAWEKQVGNRSQMDASQQDLLSNARRLLAAADAEYIATLLEYAKNNNDPEEVRMELTEQFVYERIDLENQRAFNIQPVATVKEFRAKPRKKIAKTLAAFTVFLGAIAAEAVNVAEHHQDELRGHIALGPDSASAKPT